MTKTKVLLERTFKKRPTNGKGLLVCTAQLGSLFGQKPRFHIDGLDPDEMPELKILKQVDSCDSEGAPMYAVENAIYHIERSDATRLAEHWGLDLGSPEALKSFNDNLACLIGKARLDEEIARKELLGLTGYVNKSLTDLSKRLKGRLGGTYDTILEELREVERLRIQAMLKIFPQPDDPSRNTSRLLERIKFKLKFHGYRVNWDDIKSLKAQLLDKLKDDVQEVHKFEKTKLSRIPTESVQPYVEEWVEELRPEWKRRAEAAKELLASDEPLWEEPQKHSCPATASPAYQLLIEVDGDIIELDESSIHTFAYLPLVHTGAAEYYLAENAEHAGSAAKEYWEDLRESDPEEFVALIGADTFVSWATNRKAGPGTTKVCSYEEWLEVVAGAPQEQFATYDGVEVRVKISTALAEHLEFTVEHRLDAPDRQAYFERAKQAAHLKENLADGWLSVLAYRAN